MWNYERLVSKYQPFYIDIKSNQLGSHKEKINYISELDYFSLFLSDGKNILVLSSNNYIIEKFKD